MKASGLCAAFCMSTLVSLAGEPLPGTLTTNMAARFIAGTSWYRGVLVQGPLNDTQSKADLVRFARGGQIAANWFETFDANQGRVVFWVRPEWSGNDGKERCLLQWSENGFIKKTTDNDLIFSSAAGASVATNIAHWNAGVTYRVDAFWNAYNTIDGTHHMGIGVNETNTFGVTSPYAPEPPAEYIHVGSSFQTNCAANGIIGGLSIFRRYDTNTLFRFQTSAGHNVASWDMPFGLPTSSDTTDAFAGGAGHAHTHPFTNSSLLLGNNRMGGYMLAGNYATDGWSLEGAPAVAAMTEAQKIYRGGYQATSSGANQGLYQDIAVTPGSSMAIRVVAHSDGAAIPRAVFYNQTASAVIGQTTGRSGATRLDPDILIFTCDAPAGCAAIRVKLVNTQSSGTVYWHQAEVLDNRIRTPSVETGAVNTNGAWLPTGWNCNYNTNESFQETANVHSGASAVRVQKSGSGFEGLTVSLGGSSTFNTFGWWGSRQGGYFHTNTRPAWSRNTYTEMWWMYDANSNYWHSAYICRAASSVAIARSSGASTAFTDDVYFFPLRNIVILALLSQG